jgi:hypothetical protein
MTAPADILRRETILPDAPGAAAAVLEPLLAAVAGPGAAPLSLAFDYGPGFAPGVAVTAEAWIDRATRTLVFAHARLVGVADGSVLVTCAAVLKRAAASVAAA